MLREGLLKTFINFLSLYLFSNFNIKKMLFHPFIQNCDKSADHSESKNLVAV